VCGVTDAPPVDAAESRRRIDSIDALVHVLRSKNKNAPAEKPRRVLTCDDDLFAPITCRGKAG
jgi:hypothetical protein